MQSGAKPLDEDEARSLLLHLEFEKFYERYCEQRGIPADGPLSDDAGPDDWTGFGSPEDFLVQEPPVFDP